MTSALRAAAVPKVERSSSLRAAGVRFPGASAFRGVEEGGGIELFLPPGVRPPKPIKSALARRLLDALLDNRCEMTSRAEISRMWKGESGMGTGSSDDMTRGVASSVPQVISWFTAFGPSSAGVGEGIFGTKEKLLAVGDLGL
jgi:hypothetical protein